MLMQRTCGVTGSPISATPAMAGATISTSRASLGPRSTPTVCHARVLYSTATSTRAVIACRLREGYDIDRARNTNVHRHSFVIAVVGYRRTRAYTA
jgi:hypothetical protein